MALALLLEMFSAWLLMSADSTWSMMLASLALHCAASVLLVRALWGPPDARARAIVSGVVSLLAFPLVGMVGMVVGLAVTWGSAPLPKRLASAAELEEPSRASRVLDAARPVDVQRELAIEPIVDLLREDDIDVKREAIDALVRVDRRLAVGILQTLIRDPHGDIRLYASIALSRIEDDVASEMMLARQAVTNAPTDPDARERLAALYVDYGLSGLVNGGARHRFLALASDEYAIAHDLRPDDSGTASALGRVHALRGEWEAAHAMFGDAVAHNPDRLDARLGLMELAFESGNLDDVAGHAAGALPLVDGDHPQSALVDWWASRSEEKSG